MSVSVIPYLSFEGNCEEAVRLYAEIFGGKTLYLSRWSELSAKYPAQVGKIMHVEFLVGNTRMGAGDSFDRKGTHANIKLMVHMDDPQKAADTCGLLSQGGCEISPLQPHPAPDDGGMGALIEDRFGYRWIITCPNPDKR
ncbi:MAG TPA: hypothetical protein GXZ67_06720 [Clostridiaceae bacterium]|jgi:PhnB protein|nr:hypothetical protein [Clostridiaceae bacterium]